MEAVIFRSPETEQESKPNRHRTRCAHDRSRVHRNVAPLAKALGIELPPLQTFAQLSNDQFAAICAQIETALKAVTNGIISPTIPSYDIQIENYRLWRERSGPN